MKISNGRDLSTREWFLEIGGYYSVGEINSGGASLQRTQQVLWTRVVGRDLIPPTVEEGRGEGWICDYRVGWLVGWRILRVWLRMMRDNSSAYVFVASECNCREQPRENGGGGRVSFPLMGEFVSRRSDELQKGGIPRIQPCNSYFCGADVSNETFSIFPPPAWKTIRSSSNSPAPRAGTNQTFPGGC